MDIYNFLQTGGYYRINFTHERTDWSIVTVVNYNTTSIYIAIRLNINNKSNQIKKNYLHQMNIITYKSIIRPQLPIPLVYSESDGNITNFQ